MAAPRFTSADAFRYIARALLVLPMQARAARAGLAKLLDDVQTHCNELMAHERAEAARHAAMLVPGSASHRMILDLGEGQARIIARQMRQDYECAVCDATVPNCVAAGVAGCHCAQGTIYRVTHWPEGHHIATDTDQNAAAWAKWDAQQPVRRDGLDIPAGDYLPRAEPEIDEVGRLLSRLGDRAKLIKIDLRSDGGVIIPPELRASGFVDEITQILKADAKRTEGDGVDDAGLRAMMADLEGADRSITSDRALAAAYANTEANTAAVGDTVAELEKLRDFKAYVHYRLDAAGIAMFPNGPHSAKGCRIGDRLDIALDGYQDTKAAAAELEAKRRDEDPIAILKNDSPKADDTDTLAATEPKLGDYL